MINTQTAINIQQMYKYYKIPTITKPLIVATMVLIGIVTCELCLHSDAARKCTWAQVKNVKKRKADIIHHTSRNTEKNFLKPFFEQCTVYIF